MHRTIIIAICILVQSIAGQLVPGCSNVDSVNQFNLASFQGSWFVIESANVNNNLADSPTCGRLVNSSPGADGSASVSYSQIVDNELTTYLGAAVPVPTFPGVLGVVLLQGDVPIASVVVNIVAVDYSDYALLMVCRTEGTSLFETSWKLSRSRTELSSTSVTAINQVVAGSSQLTGLTWETIDQTTATCGSSAVSAASSVLLLILAVSGLTGRT